MSIADQENIRQLLKRVAAIEEKVKALEAARDALVPKAAQSKGLLDRARKVAQNMEI